MFNKDTFATDPAQFHIANQGVAKVRLPPAKDEMPTLRGELQTFVCDGAEQAPIYADGTLGVWTGSTKPPVSGYPLAVAPWGGTVFEVGGSAVARSGGSLSAESRG